MAGAFTAHADAQWLVGRYEIIDADDRPIRPPGRAVQGAPPPPLFLPRLLRENFLPQPAVFWRRSFGDEAGPLDESLNWTMDYDLWLRMGRRCDPLVVDQLLARFRVHARRASPARSTAGSSTRGMPSRAAISPATA